MILYFYNMDTYKEINLSDFIKKFNNNELKKNEFSAFDFLIFKDLEAFKKYPERPPLKDLHKNTPYENKQFALTDKEIQHKKLDLDMDYIENDNL